MIKPSTFAEKAIVTFVEAATAFATVQQFSTSTPTKVGTAGVIAGAISLLYNYFREAEPTLGLPAVVAVSPVTPVEPTAVQTPVTTPEVIPAPEVTPPQPAP